MLPKSHPGKPAGRTQENPCFWNVFHHCPISHSQRNGRAFNSGFVLQKKSILSEKDIISSPKDPILPLKAQILPRSAQIMKSFSCPKRVTFHTLPINLFSNWQYSRASAKLGLWLKGKGQFNPNNFLVKGFCHGQGSSTCARNGVRQSRHADKSQAVAFCSDPRYLSRLTS